MRKRIIWMAVVVTIAGGVSAVSASAQKPPLLPEKDVAALANELSGETAKRNLEVIATFHRQRGSRGFHSAAELVAERARAVWVERCADIGVSGGWEDFLWNAEVAAGVGCGSGGIMGGK